MGHIFYIFFYLFCGITGGGAWEMVFLCTADGV